MTGDAQAVDAHAVDPHALGHDENGNSGTVVDVPPQDTRTRWQIWKPRILLIAAVFLPVFLETLDYTGTCSLYALIAQ